MTKYTVSFTKIFDREFDKLSKIDQKRVMKTLSLLKNSPFYPSLRTKKMEGGDDTMESRVNRDMRIIWQFDEDDGNIIVALDVGHHDVLKG